MKFKRLPVHLLAGTKVPELGPENRVLRGMSKVGTSIFMAMCRGAWQSTCFRVILVMRKISSLDDDNYIRAFEVVEAYAGTSRDATEHIVSIRCREDGSAAFVAAEVMDYLADYEFTTDDDLKRRLGILKSDMTYGGRDRVTLPRYHKYKKGKP